MVGVDRQHALVGPRGILEFPRALVRNGFDEKLPDLAAGAGRVRRGRRVALRRRAALLSVHRPLVLRGSFLKFSRRVEIQICCLTARGGFYNEFSRTESFASG